MIGRLPRPAPLRRIGFAAALGGALVAAPLVAAGTDTVILRNGERRSGHLTACAGEECRWDGRALPRADIAWIGFDTSGGPPAPPDPARDAIWPRTGGVENGPIVGISLGVVATEASSFDRSEVAWIYFGSLAGAPAVAAPSAEATTPPAVPPPAPKATTAPGETASGAPAGESRLLLEEVAPLPAEGGYAFVELRNPGADPIPLAGVVLRNGSGARCELAAERVLAPGALHLIQIGEASDAAAGASRCPAGFLAASAELTLLSGSTRWDFLDWGDSPRGLALRTRGGRIADVRSGTSFGRPPREGGAAAGAAWVRYAPFQVTPGAPNPLPAVDSVAALPGAVFTRARVPLSWYTVGGATSYRVQVARSADFAAPLLDRPVAADHARANRAAQLVTDPLPAGTYYWRVQAIAGSIGAPPSPTQSFEVDLAGEGAAPSPSTKPGAGERRAGDGDATPAPAASPPPAADERTTVVLGVPWIEQFKDTQLLALEADMESGPKPWDRRWTDQAPYCARASIAMVNAFYGGKLSQDRITHEVFRDWLPGPEVDIYTDAGLNAVMIENGLKYALGGPVSRRFLIPDAAWEEEYRRNLGYGMFLWRHVVDEIDAGRPVLGTSECHAWVYGGYRKRHGELELLIIDPAIGLYYFRPAVSADFERLRALTGGDDEPAGTAITETYFLPPREAAHPASDEASIATDADGDGVMDFDEKRFGTKPDDPDSDRDGVHDKQEIRASVFEPPQGWSLRTRNLQPREPFPSPTQTGRNLDGDALAMELDPDSDGGGCKDGEEDLDGDGVTDPGEPSNFDPADDPIVDGVCDYWTGTSTTRFWTSEASGWTEILIEAHYRVRGYRVTERTDPGPAAGGRHAGDRIGRSVLLSCEGTTLHTTWRQRYWAPSWTCNCSGEGNHTVPADPDRMDGFIETKVVDWDLTPLYGFDVPRQGGLYTLACGQHGEHGFSITCNCTDSGTTTSDGVFPYPAGAGLGNPTIPVRCNHDPEIRSLAGNDTQMMGSYSIYVPECAPQGADMTWSLCKAGKPCAALPPLPGRSPAGGG